MSEPNIKDLLNEEIAMEIQNLSEFKAGSDEKSIMMETHADIAKQKLLGLRGFIIFHQQLLAFPQSLVLLAQMY